MEATLRFGNKPWPELPHVYLANMDATADVRAFTKIYGQLCWGGELAPDGNVDFVRNAQKMLRKAWANDSTALRKIAEGEPQRPHGYKIDLGLNMPAYTNDTHERFHLSITENGLEIEAEDVWSFAQLAFLRDHRLGKTHICANPECKTPYFLQSKKGQIYCSHRCAVAMNVRRFRAGKSSRSGNKKGKNQ